MNLEDLDRREKELCLIVSNIQGTMEHRFEQLRDQGVFDAYRQVHSAYADKAEEDVESLKRGLFIQWYAMTEPSCFTGINDLDSNAERKIIEEIDKLVKCNILDKEMRWMLEYYSTWDFVFKRFKEYEGVMSWMHNEIMIGLPDTIDRSGMFRRGQMGKYWNSIKHFAK